jgi:chemotaxis protein methyltransferase CheR
MSGATPRTSQGIAISDAEFAEVRQLAMRLAGINLLPSKKMLVVSRWGKRLAHHGCSSFREYLDLVNEHGGADELRISLDLLTTNETYFFREPKHFEFLRDRVLPTWKPGSKRRIWSAACSSGEEPYSLAMLLSARMTHTDWEVLGTDISTRVIRKAATGLYDIAQAEQIPADERRRYCLRGIGPQEGQFLMAESLRSKVRFQHVNLNETLPHLGEFDVILLRNVMIYFDNDTKARIVDRILACLRPGGHFIIGHCDSMSVIPPSLKNLQASVYQKASP